MENKTFSQKIDSFAEMLEERNLNDFVSNFNCENGFLTSGSTTLPYTKTSMKNRKACYTVSQMSHNYHYAKREIEIENLGFSRFIVYPMLETLALFLRMAKIDNSIMLNNWGISTNLYPRNPNLDEFGQIIDSVLINNKKDAIIFRSINSTTCSDLEQYLVDYGFNRIFSRNIILFPYTKLSDYKRANRRQINRDLKLQKEHGLHWEMVDELTEEQALSVKNLYDQLYLDKYSKYNPQFTLDYFLGTIQNEIYTYHLLYKDDEMVGVLGMFTIDGLSTNPILGYDFNQEFSDDLYRVITSRIATFCSEHQLRRHASSGAMEFKKLRGGISVPEYTMVYTKNLNWFRRLNWSIFRFISIKIAKPIIMRMENS